MSRRSLLVVLFGVWAALWLASVLVPAQMAPSGEGFTRGFNRVAVFYRYQVGAASVAVAIWWLGRASGARRITRIPLVLALVVVLLTLGIILAA